MTYSHSHQSSMPRNISCSNFVCQPIGFFIVSSFLILCGPCLLISLWINEVKGIKEEVKVISHEILQEILSEIGNIDTQLAPLYASTSNLARYVGASNGKRDISLPIIQKEVAPTLFQALLTIPHLSQISYIGFDGLFFSYFVKENHHFVLYSNDSLSSSLNSIWYTQSINEDLGTPNGEAVLTSPYNVDNISYFQEAFTSKNKSTSVGYGWNNSEVLLFSNTLCLNRKGLVSLGFPISFLEDHFSSVIFHNGSLYLDVENGIPLIQGIPNTHVIFSNNSISFISVNEEGDEIDRLEDVTCQPNGDELNLWGTKYIISCSKLQIFGIELEYVLVVPNEPLESLTKKDDGLAYDIILIPIIISMIISVLFFVIAIVSTSKREVCLCAALIKQMEATQQAEQKSMNKSLAFARASHDVRTCIAGINGLIEISRDGVPQKSELGTNLMQVEECTKDLLGILNSILDTSKIEAGKLQLTEEDFDLQKLVEDVVDFHYNIGMKKGVDIILDLSDGSLPKYSSVKGDRGKLKQVLDNLLNNAIKFTQEGHVIVRVCVNKPCLENEIIVSNRNSMVNKYMARLGIQNVRDSQPTSIAQCNPKCMEFVFEVNDTGVGIPKEKQKSVFENYVQVNEAKSGQEGTGLGLGIVQSLVRLIGGEISIVDKLRGERGTCFRFNAYFTSELNECGDNEIGSLHGSGERKLHQTSNTRFHIPTEECSSQVIIFIKNDERGRIIKHFMESRGIKVFVAKDHKEFCSCLQKIRRKSPLRYHGSSGQSCLSSPMSHNSSPKSKDFPLSVMDGRTDISTKNTSSFTLILIDSGSSTSHETNKVLHEFRREMQSRVVWMRRFGSQNIEVEDIDDSTDVIVSKPLHGSRLNQILKVLPEYGGLMHDDLATSNGNTKADFNLRVDNGLDTQRPMIGKRVLVVEDNNVQQMVTKQVLSKLGAEVCLCGTGAKAVELVANGLKDRSKQPYDYIFMDCKMDGMDGFEASRRIREEEKKYGVHVTIIALTSHAIEDVKQLTKKAGMDHYLSKPLKRDQLLEVIELPHWLAV